MPRSRFIRQTKQKEQGVFSALFLYKHKQISFPKVLFFKAKCIFCGEIYNDKEVNLRQYSNEIKNDLETLKNIIIKTVPTEQIYLFGSYAYGTPHKDSDLDIYIVVKDNAPKRELDYMDDVNEAMYKKITMPVDVLALRKNRFDDRITDATMERKIIRDGVKIYG